MLDYNCAVVLTMVKIQFPKFCESSLEREFHEGNSDFALAVPVGLFVNHLEALSAMASITQHRAQQSKMIDIVMDSLS